MGFCDNSIVKSTPLYLPCYLLNNRRMLSSVLFAIVCLIIVIILWITTKSTVTTSIAGVAAVVGTGLVYKYDLITRLGLYIFAPGVGQVVYESVAEL